MGWSKINLSLYSASISSIKSSIVAMLLVYIHYHFSLISNYYGYCQCITGIHMQAFFSNLHCCGSDCVARPHFLHVIGKMLPPRILKLCSLQNSPMHRFPQVSLIAPTFSQLQFCVPLIVRLVYNDKRIFSNTNWERRGEPFVFVYLN